MCLNEDIIGCTVGVPALPYLFASFHLPLELEPTLYCVFFVRSITLLGNP